MYTLGTSAIRALRQQLKDLDPVTYATIIDALGIEGENEVLTTLRIVAFVGSIEERGDPTVDGSTILAPYSAFFITDINTTQVQLQIPFNESTPANMWTNNPETWAAVGVPFSEMFLQQAISPAGSLMNAQYAFARGYAADLPNIPQIDGVPYFAKDTKALHIYDKTANEWVAIKGGGGASGEVGSLLTYASFMPTIPEGYLRCDGQTVTTAAYPELYTVIGNAFNNGTLPIGQFMLPKQSNLIIRAVAT